MPTWNIAGIFACLSSFNGKPKATAPRATKDTRAFGLPLNESKQWSLPWRIGRDSPNISYFEFLIS